MKMECDVIQDLLPLYEEGLCSEASRTLVEAHLAECPRCAGAQKLADRLCCESPDAAPEQEDAAVARSFRKVRRRWWTSLIGTLLAVPVLWLSVNQLRGQGLCFSNLDDVWKARRYAAALADGDWEKAAGLMDYGHLYGEVQEILSWDLEHYVQEAGAYEDPQYLYEFNRSYYAEAENMTREEFAEYVRSRYVSDLEMLETCGYTFRLVGFKDAYYAEENGGWTIVYGLNVSDGDRAGQLSLQILVREGGLSLGAMSYSELLDGKLDLAETLFMGYPNE